MDDSSIATPSAQDASNAAFKRKRSSSAERPGYSAPPAKAAKIHTPHLQINYLAQLYSDTLPLISVDETLPSLLQLIGDYAGVLDRHESMAGNLGARPLGPILIKRFERLFEGPPKVLKSHGKEGTTVTWLDVVEFARHKPEQFNLEKTRDGVRVCQFYTKQSRVEISEEDYVLIASGMPQKLIPPQPIAEDEEKELGTLEILEKNMGQLIQLTDQVAGRARQLVHRLKNRRNAIISRREVEASVSETGVSRGSPPPFQGQEQASSSTEQRDSSSPTSGFVAVNSRPPPPNYNTSVNLSLLDALKPAVLNGKSFQGASALAATRADLLSCFTGARERLNDYGISSDYENSKSQAALSRPQSTSKPKPRPSNDIADYANILLNSASPVPIPSTPSALQHYAKAAPVDKFDDSGPYKAEMLSRMDSMQRGDRVLPPCDRCRRLHMDCLKNLTACLGCTKKHAKCSWKDVTEQELIENRPVDTINASSDAMNGIEAYEKPVISPDGTPHGVPDEELLGEESDDGRDHSTAGIRLRTAASYLEHDSVIPSKEILDTLASTETVAPKARMVRVNEALEGDSAVTPEKSLLEDLDLTVNNVRAFSGASTSTRNIDHIDADDSLTSDADDGNDPPVRDIIDHAYRNSKVNKDKTAESPDPNHWKLSMKNGDAKKVSGEGREIWNAPWGKAVNGA
ncbi:hypothetical protein MMC19_003801 [Ptychographa xylographoides]|nr:hypothetical protein [Ptychographa xylographoides]